MAKEAMCRTHIPFEDFPMSQDGSWGNTVRFMTQPPDRKNIHKGITLRIKRFEGTSRGEFFLPDRGWETREWIDEQESQKHLHVRLVPSISDIELRVLASKLSTRPSEEIREHIALLSFAESCRAEGIALCKPTNHGLATLFNLKPDGTGHIMAGTELHGDMVWQGHDVFPFRYNFSSPPYFFEQVVSLFPLENDRQLKVIAGIFMSSMYPGTMFSKLRREVLKEEVKESKMREIANPYMYLAVGDLRPRYIGDSNNSAGTESS